MSEIDEILKFDPMNQKPPKNNEVDEILKFDPLPTPAVTTPQPSEKPTTTPSKDLSWGDAFMQGFKNIPKSGKEYLKGFYTALIHPVKTAKGISSLVKGMFKTGALRYMAAELGYDYKNLNLSKDTEVAAIEKIEKEILKRYGTEEGFKDAIANDPVGVWADMASLITPLAKGSKIAGSLEPMSATIKLASQPLKLLPEKLPVHLYQSAVKFGTTLTAKQRKAVTKTALKASNQIMPTNKGLLKLRNQINTLNDKISSLIDKSSKTGEKLSVKDIYKELGELKTTIKRTSDEPLKAEVGFRQLMKQQDEALKEGLWRTPAEAQKIKQRIYKDLASYYESVKSSPAKVELRKHIAKNAREMLEDVIPEIKQLNKSEGALIELWDALESKANRITNRDLISIGLPVKMGTGSGIGFMFGGEQGAAIGASLGLMLGIFDTPQVKAKIALVLGKMREKGIQIDPTIAAVNLGLYESEKLQRQGAMQ